MGVRVPKPLAADDSLPLVPMAETEELLGTLQLEHENVALVRVSSELDLATLEAVLGEDRRIVSVAQNYEYAGAITEDSVARLDRANAGDPMQKEQIHLDVMQAPEAWKIVEGSPTVVVAITDNGTDVEHEDLEASLWNNPGEIPNNGIDDDGNGFVDDVHGWNFSGSNNRLEGGDHGTHTAGLVGATRNNGLGVAGTAAGVRVMPIKWIGDRSWTSAVIAASYVYAANNGAKIVSTSYNIDSWPGDEVIGRALDYMESKGMLHFNSAGNRGVRQSPRTRLKNVILVASTEADGKKNDVRSSFSNHGAGVDLAAPGGGSLGILSTVNGGYERMSGTSMAAPNAAAVAALVWSKNPTWNREQVYAQVVGTADNIDAKNPEYVDELGAGRVNALRAVTETVGPPRLSARKEGARVFVRLRNVLDCEAANLEESWRIERADGTVVSTGAPQRVQIATNELRFDVGSLPSGSYRVVGSATTLKDPFGQALDGNGDGRGGDDFEFSFRVP